MTTKPEYIICAAIWYDDEKQHVHQPRNINQGFVLCGRRHHNCVASLALLARNTNADYAGKHVSGFLTSQDRFIDREEAVVVAFASGQIERPKKELFSEDLY